MVASLQLAAQTSQGPRSPYEIDWKKETPVLATGLGLSALGYVLIEDLEPRQASSLVGLSNDHLIGIDRKSTQYFSEKADQASDYLAGGSVLLPLTLMADRDIRRDANKIAVLLSESASLTNGLTQITKRVVLRDRPYVFNQDAPLELRLSTKSKLSFFSGHTAMTASFTFFTAQVWSDYHPESRWKPAVWAAAAAVPAVTGYLRIRAGRHYFTDVVSGYAIGALVGVLVPRLHKVERGAKRKFRFSSSMLEGRPVLVVRGLL